MDLRENELYREAPTLFEQQTYTVEETKPRLNLNHIYGVGCLAVGVLDMVDSTNGLLGRLRGITVASAGFAILNAR